MRLLSALALAALLGCSSTPEPTEEVPPVEFETGLSFEVPCQTHGSHVHTVVGSQLIRLYEIEVDDGSGGLTDGPSLQAVLEMIAVMESMQATPEAAEPASDEEESGQ